MTTIFVTRPEYDFLVTHCSAWTQLHWLEYQRSWHIGGIFVTAEHWKIENLRCQLEGMK